LFSFTINHGLNIDKIKYLDKLWIQLFLGEKIYGLFVDIQTKSLDAQIHSPVWRTGVHAVQIQWHDAVKIRRSSKITYFKEFIEN
jgi:hypothetical protein